MRYPFPTLAFKLCPRSFRSAILNLVLLGCAPWARIPVPAPATLSPTTKLQLWLGRQSVVLREVTLDTDSILGRTLDARNATSTARVAIPRAAVDCFRLQLPDSQNWAGVGGILGLLAGVAGAFAFVGNIGT